MRGIIETETMKNIEINVAEKLGENVKKNKLTISRNYEINKFKTNTEKQKYKNLRRRSIKFSR